MTAPPQHPAAAARGAELCIADARHLRFLLDLQRKFSNQVGYLPGAAFEKYLEWSRVLLVRENTEPAGYILTRNRLNSARWCRPIIQAAICYDAQRRHLGLTMLEQIARDAKRQLLEGMQCWCAADIDAVAFWQAAGFEEICRRDPNNRRGRELILYRRHFNASPPRGFYTPPTVAGFQPARIPAETLRTADISPAGRFSC